MLLTADELERMPDDGSMHIELDEGEFVTSPWSSEALGWLKSLLLVRLYDFVKTHGLGRVYGPKTGFRLSYDTVRSPDVAFVRKERVAEIRSQGFAKGAPDLAVEILSPSNSFRQMTRKVRQYFAAGCHTVWVVHPDRKEVEVFESTGADRTLTVENLLEAPDLLPGFSVPVEQLFAE